MRFDQNPIVDECRMIGCDQQRQCFISIGIVLDLPGLRVRRGNYLIMLEMVMDNSLPLRNKTLTELWYVSCARITAFNHGEGVFWTEFFVCWHIDAVTMRNATQIDVESTNR